MAVTSCSSGRPPETVQAAAVPGPGGRRQRVVVPQRRAPASRAAPRRRPERRPSRPHTHRFCADVGPRPPPGARRGPPRRAASWRGRAAGARDLFFCLGGLFGRAPTADARGARLEEKNRERSRREARPRVGSHPRCSPSACAEIVAGRALLSPRRGATPTTNCWNASRFCGSGSRR